MDLDLGDARVEALGRRVGLADEGDLGPETRFARGEAADRRSGEGPSGGGAGPARTRPCAGDGRRGQGGPLDLVEREVVRVPEPRPVAAEDPDAQPQADRLGRLLDDVLLHVDEVVGPVLHEDLGELAAAREGDAEHRAQIGRSQAK